MALQVCNICKMGKIFVIDNIALIPNPFMSLRTKIDVVLRVAVH